MKKIIKILILIAAIIIFAFLAYKIQYNYLVKILDKVENINSIKYQSLMSYGEPSSESIFSNSYIYRRGKGEETEVRMEIFSSSSEKKQPDIITIDNSKKMYFYRPEQNTIKERDVDYIPNSEGTELSFLEENKTIKESKVLIVGKELVDGKDCLIIKQLQKTGGFIGVATHWIWIEYGLPIKTKVVDKNTISDYAIVARRNVEVNTDISNDLFIPPPGIEIIHIDN